MGCHTRYLVPIIYGIEEIKQIARNYITSNEYISPSHMQMYLYAIDNNLEEPILELACQNHSYEDGYTWLGELGEWILYKEANKVLIDEFNRVHGTNHRFAFQLPKNSGVEFYGDEPRIGGYPERVIRSYEDMIEFMATGFTKNNSTGLQHCNFYYPPERYDRIMAMIRRFFDNYPTGIIEFG